MSEPKLTCNCTNTSEPTEMTMSQCCFLLFCVSLLISGSDSFSCKICHMKAEPARTHSTLNEVPTYTEHNDRLPTRVQDINGRGENKQALPRIHLQRPWLKAHIITI
ncbi:hypothetical protein GOODEAATRI_016382 [Goodea atripinnis]|uniref:Uncharacterized protein n=1 Tax=Goodea atripinnis TaxID=208336 RepID=A0ABV0MUH3_9TELE